MSAATCGNCQHRGEAIVVVNSTYTGYCDSGYFLCARIVHAPDGPKAPAKQPCVIDGSGFYAALCVVSDFGCNRWEVASAPDLIEHEA